MGGQDIIVVGASAGGVEALTALVSDLPEDLPAAVFVVLHMGANSATALPSILSRKTKLPVDHPRDGDPLEPNRIYVAVPDRHLTVRRGAVGVANGPRENGHRPSVDTLFRSAAANYGRRVVGVVLSGTRDDGTAACGPSTSGAARRSSRTRPKPSSPACRRARDRARGRRARISSEHFRAEAAEVGRQAEVLRALLWSGGPGGDGGESGPETDG